LTGEVNHLSMGRRQRIRGEGGSPKDGKFEKRGNDRWKNRAFLGGTSNRVARKKTKGDEELLARTREKFEPWCEPVLVKGKKPSRDP